MSNFPKVHANNCPCPCPMLIWLNANRVIWFYNLFFPLDNCKQPQSSDNWPTRRVVSITKLTNVTCINLPPWYQISFFNQASFSWQSVTIQTTGQLSIASGRFSHAYYYYSLKGMRSIYYLEETSSERCLWIENAMGSADDSKIYTEIVWTKCQLLPKPEIKIWHLDKYRSN